MSATRVVVTGLGATTPARRRRAPRPGTACSPAGPGSSRSTEDWAETLPVQIAAPVAVEPDRGARAGSRPAGSTAPAQFALSPPARPGPTPACDRRASTPERLGVAIGLRHRRRADAARPATTSCKEKGPRRVSPLTVPMLMPNGPAADVGLELGARAGVHTPVSACASGAEAIALGLDMIRLGRADVVVAGGTEAAIHPLPMAGFAADAGAVHPQRRARARPPARATRAATASCSARAPASLVLESRGARRGPRRADLRRGRRRRHHLRRPPHRRSPTRSGRGAARAMRDGAARRRPRRPPTSCTSTRTPPRPRSATSPRRWRSARRSATPPTGVVRHRRPSR